MVLLGRPRGTQVLHGEQVVGGPLLQDQPPLTAVTAGDLRGDVEDDEEVEVENEEEK